MSDYLGFVLNTRKPEQRYKVLKFSDRWKATAYCTNVVDRYEKLPTKPPDYNFSTLWSLRCYLSHITQAQRITVEKILMQTRLYQIDE